MTKIYTKYNYFSCQKKYMALVHFTIRRRDKGVLTGQIMRVN